MATPIILPELGTGDEPVCVSGWLIDVGDNVEIGDRVVEILVDAITFDVSAPGAGVLVRMEKPFGSTIAPGDVLGWIETEHGERPAWAGWCV